LKLLAINDQGALAIFSADPETCFAYRWENEYASGLARKSLSSCRILVELLNCLVNAGIENDLSGSEATQWGQKESDD
tara:strand:- start:1519 stop:1752 length:234 start_codon:yes stop_codon:yes gene_type:complete